MRRGAAISGRSLLGLALLWSPTTVLADDMPDAKEKRDLEQLQGTWEIVLRDGDGKLARRMVKSLSGVTETVTHFDADGRVVYLHTAAISVSRSGDVRVFAFTKLEITAGPLAGKVTNGSGRYVYRVEGEAFFEFQGVLIGEQRPPAVYRWQRVLEKQGRRPPMNDER